MPNKNKSLNKVRLSTFVKNSNVEFAKESSISAPKSDQPHNKQNSTINK